MQSFLFLLAIKDITDSGLGFAAVTPGITALEYANRRSKLASKLPKNAVAVVAAADLKYRSTDAFYEYHQDANFFYLTGTAWGSGYRRCLSGKPGALYALIRASS